MNGRPDGRAGFSLIELMVVLTLSAIMMSFAGNRRAVRSRARPGRRREAGFALIEVIGALVIFSVGVMVIRLSTATGTQMRYAGVSSELAVRAAEGLDSLEAASSSRVGTIAWGER